MMYYQYFKNNDSSTTIMLLHGWGVSSSYMESLKDYLIRDYNVLLVDLPGHGKSYLQKPYSINDYIDELFLIINKENINKIYGIGHSFGGKLLGYYSLKYKLNGMILIAPSLIKPHFSFIKLMKILIYKILRRFNLKIPKHFQGSYDYKKASGLKRKTFLNVCHSYLTKKELRKIKIKSLIMGFKDDKEVKIYQLKKLDKYLLDSKLFIYPGNHFSYFDHYFDIRKLLILLESRE